MSNIKSIGQWLRGLRLPKIRGFPLTLNVALTTVLRTNVLHCDTLSCFDAIPECGQTNKRTELLYQYRPLSSVDWCRILLQYIMHIFTTGGAYAPYAPCLSTPLSRDLGRAFLVKIIINLCARSTFTLQSYIPNLKSVSQVVLKLYVRSYAKNLGITWPKPRHFWLEKVIYAPGWHSICEATGQIWSFWLK